ncbi:MAG: M20/M25/M40 family metallo-hydrolase [Thermoplasmata archaeon]
MDERAALLRLVRAYSPTGQESPGVHVFGEIARHLGYEFCIDPIGNGIASRGKKPHRLMFLGHIDTVEGVIPIRSNRRAIAGRGACDAKASLIAALYSGAAPDLTAGIQIVAAVGEERDSRGAQYLVGRYRPNYLIVGEPTGWDGITIAYKGELRLQATFEGTRSHLSSPAPSTVDQALAWASQVRAICEGHRGPTPFQSVTMKVVQIGTHLRGGRESVDVDLDLRLPLSIRAISIYHEISVASPPTIALRAVVQVDPVEVERRNRVVQLLSAAIRSEGGTPTLYRKAGTSDLNTVLPAWQCPAAVYGPGDSHLDHTDQERAELPDLRRAVRVLVATWTRLGEGNPS